MKLTFLGSGSFSTVGANNFQSNMLLEDEKKNRLLIDCGSDVRHSLFELGYTHRDINSVYLSHLHSDHVGGMEWLALSTYFDKSCQKPNLYIAGLLVHDLWDKVLCGGLSSIHGFSAQLKTFFNVKPIQNNSYFRWSHLKIYIVQTVHVMSEYTLNPSFGLLFTANKKRSSLRLTLNLHPIN